MNQAIYRAGAAFETGRSHGLDVGLAEAIMERPAFARARHVAAEPFDPIHSASGSGVDKAAQTF